MECFFFFIIIVAGFCFICGPIALIIALNARNKITDLEFKLRFQKTPFKPVTKQTAVKQPEAPQEPLPVVQQPPPTPEPRPLEPQPQIIPKETIPAPSKESITKVEKEPAVKFETLEQKIGTKWILIAGVITVIVGVALFLKYVYDENLIGPRGIVLIVGGTGLAALVLGEITRRRGYGIVARGVTALGFAIIYADIFTAQQYYGLIGSTTAFLLASIVTAAALVYAVTLDEILIAFLSLLGGYLTPVIVSTGQNLPMPLFTYTLILSLGAMLAAFYRKWRAVDWIAFLGTYFLYASWFDKFYLPSARYSSTVPEQIHIALGWLSVFFILYLIMPLIYELINKLKSKKEDIILLLINAAVVIYFLWSILHDDYRHQLALCSLFLSAVHLGLMALVAWRCKDDIKLRQLLLAIAVFFLTIAVPLRFETNATAIIWTAMAVVLSLIGLRFRSILTQTAAAILMFLSLYKLLLMLPLHTEQFNLVFNSDFGTWFFFIVAVFAFHLIYRKTSDIPHETSYPLAQLLYVLGIALLFLLTTMEWYHHCDYNITETDKYLPIGQMVIFSAALLLFTIRPLRPAGLFIDIMSLVTTAIGLMFLIFWLSTTFHETSFTLFANWNFAAALLFIAVMTLYHIISRLAANSAEDQNGFIAQVLFGLITIILFVLISLEWYSHCKCNLLLKYFSPEYLKGQTLILSVFIPLVVLRPVCPKGLVSKILALAFTTLGSMFIIFAFHRFYTESFSIFLNKSFPVALLFILALFLSAWLLYRNKYRELENKEFAVILALAGVFVLWIILTEEVYLYWYCRNRYAQPFENWEFLAQMYISIMWAVYGALLMVIGFWRNIKILRYIAIALFTLLLAKIFIWDTRRVENLYRIAAFLATGVTLLAVSYLYQFLKKKGFFDIMLGQQSEKER
ncbi:MAG: DUF2339 domain-containing protein [Planctomycetota bacterium]|jgi:uncharacterized membrane protein